MNEKMLLLLRFFRWINQIYVSLFHISHECHLNSEHVCLVVGLYSSTQLCTLPTPKYITECCWMMIITSLHAPSYAFIHFFINVSFTFNLAYLPFTTTNELYPTKHTHTHTRRIWLNDYYNDVTETEIECVKSFQIFFILSLVKINYYFGPSFSFSSSFFDSLCIDINTFTELFVFFWLTFFLFFRSFGSRMSTERMHNMN